MIYIKLLLFFIISYLILFINLGVTTNPVKWYLEPYSKFLEAYPNKNEETRESIILEVKFSKIFKFNFLI